MRQYTRPAMIDSDVGRTSAMKRLARFRCECGSVFVTIAAHIESGHTKSCGCHRKKALTHGLRYSREWNTWSSMKGRCLNPHSKDHADYGARGIKVCDRWLNSFENFYEDMGAKPSSRHSIDRIDNDGDYEPSNCRWATGKEQSRNKRTNVNLTYDCRTMCAKDWAAEFSLNYWTLLSRVRAGWSMDRIANTKARRSGR